LTKSPPEYNRAVARTRRAADDDGFEISAAPTTDGRPQRKKERKKEKERVRLEPARTPRGSSLARFSLG
jgi:hypothetical protein